MFTKIDHIALHIKNLELSSRFYIENFGFEKYFYNVVPGNLQILYLKLGDTILELNGHSDGQMAGFHFCLHTSDFDTAISTLLKNNVKMLCQPHQTNARNQLEQGWRRTVFEGPDGEQIEIRG